jgi:magnesium transporter
MLMTLQYDRAGSNPMLEGAQVAFRTALLPGFGDRAPRARVPKSPKTPKRRRDLDIIGSTIGRLYLSRAVWLCLLTAFGVATSTLVAAQEELLSSVVILAAFLAPIIDMGGNTGSQSATLVIRGLATGTVRPRWSDLWVVLRREACVAVLLGATVATLEGVLAIWAKHVDWDVLLIVGLTMVTVTIVGGLTGAALPFAARALKRDPATISAPLLTSLMDLIGVVIYFAIAAAILTDTIG